MELVRARPRPSTGANGNAAPYVLGRTDFGPSKSSGLAEELSQCGVGDQLMRRRAELMIGLGDQEVTFAVTGHMVGHRNTQGFQPLIGEHVSKLHHAMVIKLVCEPRCRDAAETDYLICHRVPPFPAAMNPLPTRVRNACDLGKSPTSRNVVKPPSRHEKWGTADFNMCFYVSPVRGRPSTASAIRCPLRW